MISKLKPLRFRNEQNKNKRLNIISILNGLTNTRMFISIKQKKKTILRRIHK